MSNFEKKKTKKIPYFQRGSIRQQMVKAYIWIGVIPISIFGIFLVLSSYNRFSKYNMELLESFHQRASMTMYEITTQTYNISNKMIYDARLRQVLTVTDENEYLELENEDFIINDVIDVYDYSYGAISQIEIYSDNPWVSQNSQVMLVDESIAGTSWYKKAMRQQSAFWQGLISEDEYGQEYYNISLVQKIPLGDSDYNAVIVLRISDNYLNTKLKDDNYTTLISIGKEKVSFSTDRSLLGTPLDETIPVDTDDVNYKFSGTAEKDGIRTMLYGSTFVPYRTDSCFYIATTNSNVSNSLYNVMINYSIVLVVALVLPLISIYIFTGFFAKRVTALRDAMHQVATGDYDLSKNYKGEDEISESFNDLIDTAKQIEERDAYIYEAKLAHEEFNRRQKEMEFEVLSSQINPHFLYNTLETIRMKALTVKDTEVANATKMLGKIMRYVLNNSGSQTVALKSDIEYINNYLMIQKLRFGDRIDYSIDIDSKINQEKAQIIPLLLQPIVENGLIHGLKEASNGLLSINIKTSNIDTDNGPKEALIVEIEDNGCGMSDEALGHLKEQIEKAKITNKSGDKDDRQHVGIANVSSRISLNYGLPYRLDIASKENEGTRVTLVLPYLLN